MTTIVTERPYYCIVRVWHGETWYDALPQFVDEAGVAFDLTGKTLELFVRPNFDHATRLKLLTSVASAGIVIDSAASGMVSFFLSQAAVEAALPISNSAGWRQFLRLSWTDELLGPVKKIIWTGPLLVFPAKDDA